MSGGPWRASGGAGARVASIALLGLATACAGGAAESARGGGDAGSRGDAADARDATGGTRDAGTGGDAGGEGALDGGAADAGDAGAPPVEPVAEPGPARAAHVGERVAFDGAASRGALSYAWSFGNGTRTEPSVDARAEVVYDAPGRYAVVLTVTGAGGARHAAQTSVAVTWPATFEASHSATLTRLPGAAGVVVVRPDSDELAVVERGADGGWGARYLPTADGPRTVTLWRGWFAVPCDRADAVELVPASVGPDAPARRTVALPRGSRPYGAAVQGGRLYVTLQALGELAELDVEAGEPVLRRRLPAVDDARGVAALPDGRVAVSRWRAGPAGAELAFVEPRDGVVTRVPLQRDPQRSSDTELGGDPGYLGPLVVTPDGRDGFVPSLQAASHEGLYLTGRSLTFETVLRAVVSRVDLVAGAERFPLRKQFDNRGFAAAAALSSRGDWLFVAMRGNRAVERFDTLTGDVAGSIVEVGFAPEGLVLSADDTLLFVDAALSREVVVYDVTDFSRPLQPLARVPTASREALPADVLLGKRLFNDSADPRLSKDGYVACAHCHLDGDSDLRVWDFTDRGEGLRNTISLLGRGGLGHGPVHWSANFDEIQDFENDVRGPFGGAGLTADADFFSATHREPLGAPKAGLSVELDALAAYVTSLGPDTLPPSPSRAADGQPSEAARRGAVLFASEAVGCARCHAGASYTDSAFVRPGVPRLHDVGTLGAGSGRRLGAPLAGLDTPTLLGLPGSAPYLHDGSAPTLRAVLRERNVADAHGATSTLDDGALDDLEAFLRELE